MLLLTNILRSRTRGVIHLHPADAGEPPEIEFVDGEGPEQVMNQIQELAVPAIRREIEPLGPTLRWQELDLDAGVLRRRRTTFHHRLEFVLCPDELGIELVLPADGGSADGGARPWVGLRPLAEPGEDQLATIGWTVDEPDFRWRYLQTRYAPPTIEMTWSCASLPGPWAARVLTGAGWLDLRFGDGERCAMNPTRDGLLVYRGFHPLPAGFERPASLPMTLEQPLVVVGPETASPASRELAGEVPATVEALDFRAAVDGRPTRLIARADLDRRFEAVVLTAEDALLPGVIPAGAIPRVDWPLAVEPAGLVDDETEHGTAERRRWRLRPASAGTADGDGAERGRWRDVDWRDDPPSLAFGLGSYERSRAPAITFIEHRRASVGWRVEASDEGRRLCLCVPHWLPVGCPGQVAMPPRSTSAAANGFDYGAQVRTRLGGLEERFVIDQRSELPTNRLFLGPRRWRFRDQGGEAIDGEALGEGSGCVRWRRPDDGGGGELKPTDWTGGSAPVLLLRKDRDDALEWGGLYAPRPVPWEALEELAAEPTPSPDEVLLVPRASSPWRPAAIWIDLWGFVCRYDAHRTVFVRSRGETSTPTAWVARDGLELFPRRGGYLLRSFSPLYAVRDPEPRIFSLRPGAPRPTLHLGRELDAGARCADGETSLVLEIGAETFVRYQLTAPGEVPAAFEPGRVPGSRLRLDRVGLRVVWLAVEQRSGGEGRRAGYLLSWDAGAGWRFRGFFAHPGAAAELGETPSGGRRRRVFLGGDGVSRVSTFRLTLDRHGEHWSEAAPEAVTRRVTPAMIQAWENDHFTPEHRPPPLEGYGMRVVQQAEADRPWIFELFDRASEAGAGPPAGIRVWELHAGAGDEATDGARELGHDPAEEAGAQPPPAPEKRILRADDDDDF